MPDLSSPKAVAKWMKSKGLQKLRWYCQVCKKQCRDDNGMKMHMQSESHLRNMKMFAASPGKVIGQNSNAFKHGFISILKQRYPNKKVFANKVYNEYISDKNHVHMNGTCWTTLNGFVQSLGSSGICELEESERGWYITYILRDDTELKKKQRALDIARNSMDEEEKTLKRFEDERKRLEKTMDVSKLSYTKPEDFDASRSDELKSISFDLKKEEKTKLAECDFGALLSGGKAKEESSEVPVKARSRSRSHHGKSHHHAHSKREEPIHRDDGVKPDEENGASSASSLFYTYDPNDHHQDNWVCEGILVKIMNDKIGDGLLYKKKGAIVGLLDAYTAKVKVMDSSISISIDQDELQTVIPKVGEIARVINGPLRNEKVEIRVINKDADYCEAVITTGTHAGNVVKRMYYDDICKEV